MEDIKKAIEEYLESKGTTANYELYRTGFNDAASFILSKWEESTRWRKVEEELPEVKDGSYYILVKVDNTIEEEYQTLLIYKGDGEESIKRLLRVYSVTEWQPIIK